jgi:hypothetical protein
MHKNATKCNKTLSKWCKNKHGASKIIDTFETYHGSWRHATSGPTLVALLFFHATRSNIGVVKSKCTTNTLITPISNYTSTLVKLKRCGERCCRCGRSGVVDKSVPPWAVELVRYLCDHTFPKDDKHADCIIQ